MFVPPAFDFQHLGLIELITVVMRWMVCIHAHHKVKYMVRPKIGLKMAHLSFIDP